MRTKTKRVIREVMTWSSHCLELFFPWRLVAGEGDAANCVAEAGITEAYPGYELGRVRPRFHLLVYTTDGVGEVYTENETFRVRRDQLLVVPAELPFGYVPDGGRWRFLWFHLPESEKWAAIKSQGLTIRKTTQTATLEALVNIFTREARGHAESHRQAAQMLTHLMVTYLQREPSIHNHPMETVINNQFDHLCALVRADLSRHWSVGLLAEEMAVSAAHLYRLTRQYLNETPMKLVTRLRMEQAQEMLVSRRTSIAAIAHRLGYDNEFAFSVAFKRFAGDSPGKFREVQTGHRRGLYDN
jgi:AraC-like DNA-binding protein